MSKEVMKLALEALEELKYSSSSHAADDIYYKAITAIREALAEQPAQQQEPVAYIRKDQLQKAAQSPMLCEVTPEPRQDRIGIHTSPQPSKPWVGLTDQAVWNLYKNLWMFHPAEEPRLAGDILKFARAIEAKLIERNEQGEKNHG